MKFEDAGILVHPGDNVAVAKRTLAAGSEIEFPPGNFTLPAQVGPGQRFAIIDIPVGQPVLQYGSPFGQSRGIRQGSLISPDSILEIPGNLDDDPPPLPTNRPFPEKKSELRFQGFRRKDGSAGTRNFFLVLPTSQCSSEVATMVAGAAYEKFQNLKDFPNIDAIVPLPNTEGCGCARVPQVERFMGVLRNFLLHPNVGGALIIDLGCEQTNRPAFSAFLESLGQEPGFPIEWLTIQAEGGTQKTIDKALKILEKRLPETNSRKRESIALGKLVIGTECGASDSFSGITANPLIGNAVDKIIAAEGSAILSEVPEMIGAEHLLLKRIPERSVREKFRKMMRYYLGLADSLGVNMRDNLVPENQAGGLINPCIKSLGAIAKGGTSPITDVLDYGERLSRAGLNLMQGPGNDPESVTGLASSGATIICFSTGRGTITGSAIVPVIKISSTTALHEKLPDDMDFDAGLLLERSYTATLHSLGDKLLEKIVSVASGEKTRSEFYGQRQFQIWTAGKLSL